MKVISYINTYMHEQIFFLKSFNLIIFYHSIIIIVALCVELASCHSIPTNVQEF